MTARKDWKFCARSRVGEPAEGSRVWWDWLGEAGWPVESWKDALANIVRFVIMVVCLVWAVCCVARRDGGAHGGRRRSAEARILPSSAQEAVIRRCPYRQVSVLCFMPFPLYSTSPRMRRSSADSLRYPAPAVLRNGRVRLWIAKVLIYRMAHRMLQHSDEQRRCLIQRSSMIAGNNVWRPRADVVRNKPRIVPESHK
ncbi:hypothetical protein CALCODRAFT_280891 [Calocera cornea HHB12733]|uniref:Uncharacterized protein n=1 Tax=Calocera cornea HHB12733 TaxID=1353952 RepID=A0A165G0E7_9BASI|nr:hypothetical protein CALCODRAFT_280891 [Calocera cornea HHB12733]